MNMSNCTDPNIGDLLHLYELSALSEEDNELFEMHLMKCQHCYQEVLEFEYQAQALRYGEIARGIITETTPADYDKPPQPARIKDMLWPKSPFYLKPVVIYTALIILLIPAIFGVAQFMQREDDIRTVQSILLSPTRATRNNILQSAEGKEGIVRFIVPQAIPGEFYDILIADEAGNRIARMDRFSRFDEYNQGWLLIPLENMKPGIYRLIVYKSDSDSSGAIIEYRFKLNP